MIVNGKVRRNSHSLKIRSEGKKAGLSNGKFILGDENITDSLYARPVTGGLLYRDLKFVTYVRTEIMRVA